MNDRNYAEPAFEYIIHRHLLFFSTVSVEKVELKGLSHKKNDRNIDYSFEVSFSGLHCREVLFVFN